MKSDILKIFETLSKIVLDDADPTVSSWRQMQDQVKEPLERWEKLKGELAEDLSQVAKELYANEEVYQINVDPISGPWDVSEAIDDNDELGYWVSGWLWVPETELNLYRKHRKENNA